MAYINGQYSQLQLGEPEAAQQHALDAWLVSGAGTRRNSVMFGMAWLPLKDGTIGEIWYVNVVDDKEGQSAAVRIMNSFRGR